MRLRGIPQTPDEWAAMIELINQMETVQADLWARINRMMVCVSL